jgi:hypothetical protein
VAHPKSAPENKAVQVRVTATRMDFAVSTIGIPVQFVLLHYTKPIFLGRISTKRTYQWKRS